MVLKREGRGADYGGKHSQKKFKKYAIFFEKTEIKNKIIYLLIKKNPKKVN